jgi:putative transposase
LQLLGFRAATSARVILGGIEMIHTVRNRQASYVRNSQLSPAERLELFAT